MPNVDLPLKDLLAYKPELTAEDDFDAFWDEARWESAAKPLHAKASPVEHPARNARIYDIQFAGLDGTPVRGWLIVPKEASAAAPVPAVVRYHGYTTNRGKPHDFLHWTAMGVAALSLDIRGQGGETPDWTRYPTGAAAGWMTLGVLDPKTYYYRNVYMDCVRALDFIASREEIDASRLAVLGGSQGGGLTLAAASIDGRPKLAMPIYPYLCDFRRSIEQHDTGPYHEFRSWFRRFDPERKLEDQVFRTLSYFDGMNHAARIRARTLMAITLQDTTCPPSSCFAAYNHLGGEKELKLYHDFGHEALPFHEEAMMRFVAEHLF